MLLLSPLERSRVGREEAISTGVLWRTRVGIHRWDGAMDGRRQSGAQRWSCRPSHLPRRAEGGKGSRGVGVCSESCRARSWSARWSARLRRRWPGLLGEVGEVVLALGGAAIDGWRSTSAVDVVAAGWTQQGGGGGGCAGTARAGASLVPVDWAARPSRSRRWRAAVGVPLLVWPQLVRRQRLSPAAPNPPGIGSLSGPQAGQSRRCWQLVVGPQAAGCWMLGLMPNAMLDAAGQAWRWSGLCRRRRPAA